MSEQRLIDATALEQNLISKGFYPAIVKRAIENAPTIEAEPVRHGKWTDPESEEDGTTWWCSKCGHPTFIPKFDKKYDFCHHCGARMDGDAI